LISYHGKDSEFGKAIGDDRKGKLSLLIYIMGIGFSFVHPYIGFSLYVLVAAIWFIPDKRFENKSVE
jgi:uncharacterized membrane protein